MSVLDSVGNRIGGLLPADKLGYTGRARRLARTSGRTARALSTRAVHPRAALVRTYWWERQPNFGDLLTPLLLPRFGVVPILTPAASADLIGIGSLVQQLPETYAGALWGTGQIYDEAKPLPEARALALRGELTRDRIGSPPVEALGDPGLLLPHLLRRTPARTDIGVIPHYIHGQEPHFARLIAAHSSPVSLIDVRRHPLAVARAIAACRVIVTSSLHGLIVADSLGIPAVWVRSATALVGGDFKFRDHETVAKPARDRGIALSDLESLAEAVARATPADERSIRTAQDRLADAAGKIPDSTPHRTVASLTLPMHTLGRA